MPWRTIHGAHVFIGSGGEIHAGRAAIQAHLGSVATVANSSSTRDQKTTQLFNGKVEVVHAPGSEEAVRKVFGRRLESIDYTKAFGVPDGHKVEISVSGVKGIDIKVSGPEVNMKRVVKLDQDGGIEVTNFSLGIRNQGTGLGSRILAHQVAHADEYGVHKIVLFAAGNPESSGVVGYKVWPKLGFDGNIGDFNPSILEAANKQGYTNVRTVHDLYNSSKGDGVQWWDKNGGEFMGSFDLSPNSKSRQMLHNYTQAKGINVGKSIL